MNRIFKAWLVLLCLLPLCGCMAKIEINDQVFVLSLFVDKDKETGEYKVTIASPLPNRLSPGEQAGSSGAQGDPFSLADSSGTTLPLAVSKLQRQMTRKLDFSHTRVIVVGSTMAEEGMQELFNWVLRERTLDFSTFIMSSSTQAKDVAELEPIFESLPSTVLMRFAVQNNLLGTTLKECLSAYLEGTGFALSQLNVNDIKGTRKWVSVGNIQLYNCLEAKATLNEAQSKVTSWAIGRRNTPIYRPVYYVTWEGGKSKASVLMTTSKSSQNLMMTPSGPIVQLKLDGTGDVLSLEDDQQREATETNKLIIQELKNQIHEDLTASLRVSQEAGADVLGVGQLLEAKYPQLWDKWREDWGNHYKNDIEFQVKLHIKIRNTDM